MAKTLLFTGAGVAIVTPFNADGSVNYDSLRNMLEYQVENGTDAIIICGTTGEASTLTDEEQISVVKFAVDVINKRIPVIAGAGSNDTAHGVQLCKKCEEVGADGLLIVTPYYNKTTQKGLVKYYEAMAGSVNIPVIVYSVAGRTGLNIKPETVAEIAKIDNVVAIKEASGDLSQVAKIANLCGDKIAIYSGNDDQITPLLSLGGKGVISVLSNVAPEDTHNICAEYFAGNVEKSRELQIKYLELIHSLFCEVNPIPVKKALELMGFYGGNVRLPLTQLEPAHTERLKKAMIETGILA